MSNPYSPPTSPHSTAAPKITLYSAGHVAWATFLGGPFTGALIMSMNFRKWGDSQSANFALFGGVLSTLILMAVASFLPDSFPSSVLSAVCTVGMYQVAKGAQGETIAHMLRGPATRGSGWAVTGIALLCILALLLIIFAFLLVAPEAWFGEERSY